MELLYGRKRVPRCDALDEDEAFTIADPLVTESCILLLTSGIEHFEHTGVMIYYDLLSILIFDGRIVLGDKAIAINSLGSLETWLATTRARTWVVEKGVSAIVESLPGTYSLHKVLHTELNG